MRVSDFHFDLPEELIAQHPPAERGSSRMLMLDRAIPVDQPGGLTDAMFQNLPELLQSGDLLILNDSRVLPGRLFATRGGLTTQANSPQPSGVIEVLLIEQVEDVEDPTSQKRDVGHPMFLWKALVRPARKVRVGETLHFAEAVEERDTAPRMGGSERKMLPQTADSPQQSQGPGLKPLSPPQGFPRAEARCYSEREPSEDSLQPVLTAEVIAVGEFGERTLRFAPVEDFFERVAQIGHMPLPPYIRRDQSAEPDTVEDRERYQTVYSDRPGSAAAPTAGLHFTPEILASLEARGVEIQYITLHVGLGTFQPVRVEWLEEIRLHSERYTLPEATAEALNRALAEGRRIVAVGTTTTRTLEHIGAQWVAGVGLGDGVSWQRVPEAKAHMNREAGLPGLKSRPISETEPKGEPKIEAHSGSTSIFISPGHKFLIVSGLLTNFHLPESTLLMLVSAFVAGGGEPDHGRRTVLAAYAHAIRERYRFYSYGDCMLLV